MVVQVKIVYINYSIHYMEIKNSSHILKVTLEELAKTNDEP